MAIPGIGAKHAFYNDLPDEEAQALYEKLNHHALSAFETPVDYVASDLTVPSTYLICENDAVLPVQFQDMLVSNIPGMKSERCTAGHSPFLSQPDRTVEVIVKVADA